MKTIVENITLTGIDEPSEDNNIEIEIPENRNIKVEINNAIEMV
jgi:hypothetical protein